jgi:hypothetical protein
VRSWKRRLSDAERSVLLAELLLRHLARLGLPGAADDLARTVYKKVKPLHLALPPLAGECPEWVWYEENYGP